MLETIEQSLLDQLEPLTKLGLRVVGFPENPEELGRPISYGQVLIGFKRESLQPPSHHNNGVSIVQPRRVEWDVVLQIKNLRSHAGAYPVMDKIRDLLTGFRPPDTLRPLYETQADFVDLRDGIWTYNMTFAIDLIYTKKPW